MTRRARADTPRSLRRAAKHAAYKANKARKKQDVRNQKYIEERSAQALRTYDMGLRIPGQDTPSSRERPEPFSKQSERGLYLP